MFHGYLGEPDAGHQVGTEEPFSIELGRSGVEYRNLEWVAVELGVDQRWGGEGAMEGDLLRVGNRWVVLLQDRGTEQILDRNDLCLDFDKGARMRLVGEVFTGEGLVEWSGLGR